MKPLNLDILKTGEVGGHFLMGGGMVHVFSVVNGQCAGFFTDKEFAVAVKEYAERNSYRRERQKERKFKREEKLSKQKEGRKKRAKKAQRKAGGKKKAPKKAGGKKKRGRPGPKVKPGDDA